MRDQRDKQNTLPAEKNMCRELGVWKNIMEGEKANVGLCGRREGYDRKME